MNTIHGYLTRFRAATLVLCASFADVNAAKVEISFDIASFSSPQDNTYFPMAIGMLLRPCSF